MKQKLLFVLASCLIAASPAFAQRSVPYFIEPTQNEFNECTFTKATNTDGWEFDSQNKAFKGNWDSDRALNSWAFLPAVRLEAGSYEFSYEFWTSYADENFAIFIGDEPDADAMVTEIVTKENVVQRDPLTEKKTIDIDETGIYYIGLHHYSYADKYCVYIKNIKIVSRDGSLPLTPAVAATSNGMDCNFTITLPSKNIAGNALQGPVKAYISVDGNQLPDSPLQGNPGAIVSTDVTLTKGTHRYQVYASIDVNAKQLQSDFISGEVIARPLCPVPYPLPMSIEPTEDEFNWCKVINVNGDEKTWEFYTYGSQNSVRYSYNSTKEADDWFVLPVVQLEKGVYQFSLDATPGYSKESYEIGLGKEATAESLAANIIGSHLDFSSSEAANPEVYKFNVTESGLYYVGIHACSPKNRGSLRISNFNLKAIDGRQPLKPEFINTDFDGGDGTVTIKAPLTSLDAQTISNPLSIALKIDNGNEIIKSATPGENVVFDITGLMKGTHTGIASAMIFVGNDTIRSEETHFSFNTSLPAGFSLIPPFAIQMGEYFSDCALVNANGDDQTWQADGTNVFYRFHSSNNADDWLITPPVDFPEGLCNATITVDAKSETASYEERLEVWIGDQQNPSAMTEKIIDATISQPDFSPYSTDVQNMNGGRKYIGLHAVSEKNKFKLTVSTLKVEAEKVVQSGIDNISDEGNLKATVGAIMINGFAGKTACIYTPDGLLTAETHLDGNATLINLKAGIYIVRIDNSNYKVLVR